MDVPVRTQPRGVTSSAMVRSPFPSVGTSSWVSFVPGLHSSAHTCRAGCAPGRQSLTRQDQRDLACEQKSQFVLSAVSAELARCLTQQTRYRSHDLVVLAVIQWICRPSQLEGGGLATRDPPIRSAPDQKECRQPVFCPCPIGSSRFPPKRRARAGTPHGVRSARSRQRRSRFEQCDGRFDGTGIARWPSAKGKGTIPLPG